MHVITPTSPGSEAMPHPCQRCSKCLCSGERDPWLTLASALPAPRPSLYLDKSCSTSQPLSWADGRGTQWGRSPAGSPGGRPDRCTGCRAGAQRSGRLGATPPHGSTSSRHAHRLGGQEGRRVSASDSGQSPIMAGSRSLGRPCSTSLAQPHCLQSGGQGVNQSSVPDIPHLGTQGRDGPVSSCGRWRVLPCTSQAPPVGHGEGWPDSRRPVIKCCHYLAM